MKTFTTPLQQNWHLGINTEEMFIPAITASTQEILAILSAFATVVAVVLFSIWVAGIEMSEVLGASIWGAGFVFLGLSIDSHEPRAFLQLMTGIALLVLAGLQTYVSSDYAIVSGVLVAPWLADSVLARLR